MSNTPVGWKLAELLRLAGISERAFRQMRSTGAVVAPIGGKRMACYGPEHLAQIRRVLYVEKRRGMSRSAACEFVSAEAASPRRTAAVQSRNRAAAELSFKGNVRCLAPGVFLVYEKQLPSFEKGLIDEVARRFRSQLHSVPTVAAPSSTKPGSTIYRANRKTRSD